MLFFIAALGCNPKASPNAAHATFYLASSLLPLKDHLQKNAPPDLTLDLVFESSSLIAQHIASGAPCDAAIVADERWHNYLVSKALVEDSAHIVAHNALAIAARDSAKNNLSFLEFLSSLTTQKLIIADPEFVPLGAYSKEALTALGFFTKLEKQLVTAHSAQNALTLLKQGLAPYAILYASDLQTPGVYRLADVESRLHKPIFYPFLVCKGAKPENARMLRELIFSPASKMALKNAGFGQRL